MASTTKGNNKQEESLSSSTTGTHNSLLSCHDVGPTKAGGPNTSTAPTKSTAPTNKSSLSETKIRSNRLVEELTRRHQQSVPILSRVFGPSYIEPSNSNIKQIDATTTSRVYHGRLTNTNQPNQRPTNNNPATRNVIIDIRNQLDSSPLPSPRSTGHHLPSTLTPSLVNTTRLVATKLPLEPSSQVDDDHHLYGSAQSSQNVAVNNDNNLGQFSQIDMVLSSSDQDKQQTVTPQAIATTSTTSSTGALAPVSPTKSASSSWSNKQQQQQQQQQATTNEGKFQGEQSRLVSTRQHQQQDESASSSPTGKRGAHQQVVSFLDSPSPSASSSAASSSSSSSHDTKQHRKASGSNLHEQGHHRRRRLDTDSCDEQEESPDRDQLSGSRQVNQYCSSSSIGDEVTITASETSKKTRRDQKNIDDRAANIENQPELDNQRDKHELSAANLSSDSNGESTNKHQRSASFGSASTVVKRAPFVAYRAQLGRVVAPGEHDHQQVVAGSLIPAGNYRTNRRRPLLDSGQVDSGGSLDRRNALSKSYSNINNYLSNNNNSGTDHQHQRQRRNSISSQRSSVDSSNQQQQGARYQGYSNISNLFPSSSVSSSQQQAGNYYRSRPLASYGSSAGSLVSSRPASLSPTSAPKVNRVTNTLRSLLPSMATSIGSGRGGQQQTKRIAGSSSTGRLHRANSSGIGSMTPSPISRYQSPTTATTTTTMPGSQISSTTNVVHRLDRPTTAYSSYSASPMMARRTMLSRPSSTASLYNKRSPSLSSIPGFDPACPVHGYYSNSNYNLANDDYYLHSNYYSQPSNKYYGVRHATPFGTLRSSLAPANEQLRKILGSQPHLKPVHLHPQWAISSPFVHLQQGPARSRYSPTDDDVQLAPDTKPEFVPFNRLEDSQAIRAVDFHPNGEVYAIGSNSRTLRICSYPADHELRHLDSDHMVTTPRILFKFLQVHRGSIYCVAFNSAGDLIATGSNDQTVHVVRYNSITHCPEGDEYKLTMHDGTIRDLCFIDDHTNGTSLLISAGGGDNKIYVTDCDTITPFQSFAGHTAPILSLHTWGGANFVSGSMDRTIRFWDLRTRGCTSIISAPASHNSSKGPGAPVCAVRVDPTAKVLVSGHNDATCMIYDIRGGRVVQTFKPHDDEIRSVSFSPKAYYLLTAGYDGRVVLTDLQGDLTLPLPSVCVAESDDKIVQAKWHPTDFTFVTTSANKTATLWALPNN